MTPAEQRAAIERELGLCLDLDTRDTLLEALRLGPDSLAWRDALAIVDLRELGRAQMRSPNREHSERVWRRADRHVRRGRFVSIVAQLTLIAVAAAIGLLLGGIAVLALWRWL